MLAKEFDDYLFGAKDSELMKVKIDEIVGNKSRILLVDDLEPYINPFYEEFINRLKDNLKKIDFSSNGNHEKIRKAVAEMMNVNERDELINKLLDEAKTAQEKTSISKDDDIKESLKNQSLIKSDNAEPNEEGKITNDFSEEDKSPSGINSDKKIYTPPFSSLLKIAELLPKKQCEILTQEISDMRLEYYEALDEKKYLRAKFIVAFYYIGLSWSVVMWIADKVKKVIGIMPKID